MKHNNRWSETEATELNFRYWPIAVAQTQFNAAIENEHYTQIEVGEITQGDGGLMD
ncbi:hypothetical protein [Deefgea rivuli]|uniref:hypothetical protein n=1 Tax=Deefgea rivuli TaxID=400948 RepID=UPI0012EC2182|nr:hypothetical protein [Deefgea rivuli]